MAFDARASKGMSSFADSPAVKRQKTPSGYNSTSTSGKNTQAFNSDNDSGDDLFDGFVPDTPGDEYQTQPTQILPHNVHNPKSSPPNTPRSIVQVPASSPFSGRDSSATSVPKTTQQKASMPGSIAMSMAPAGTAYRPPNGIVAKGPRKEFVTIEDDDEPKYQSIISSDDEETQDLANIKPTNFISKSANSSFGALSSTSKDATSYGKDFKSIMANSAYQGPTTSKANSRVGGYSTLKKPIQNRPERAQPVVDGSAENSSEITKKQLHRMKGVLPQLSTQILLRALNEADGNVEQALEGLMSNKDPGVIEILSDDEIESPQTTRQEPQMKKALTSEVKSIASRYSAISSQPNLPITPQQKKKKLCRGRKHPSSPAAPLVPSPLKTTNHVEEELMEKEVEVVELEEEEREASYDSDSGLASGFDEEEQDPETQERVLQYLNECSLKELTDITGFPEKDIDIMISSRPFKTLDTAGEVERPTTTTKTGKRSKKVNIGTKIVDKCLAMFTGYDAVSILTARCGALGKPIKKAMDTWEIDVFGAPKIGKLGIKPGEVKDASQLDSGLGSPNSRATPNNDEDDADGQVTSRKRKTVLLTKPAMMAEDCVLKDYQVVGLNWLVLMYRLNLSAILADDMGLGKTCQVIAFLTHLIETGRKGPHVVICPGSTIANWCREIEKFSPELKFEAYHGQDREEQAEHILERVRANQEESFIHIVVTTYDMACKDKDNKFLRKLRPDVCVFDEGHMLKNVKTQRYRQLMRVGGNFRLLLTGTPLQNNLQELVALLGFILPDVFASLKDDLNFIFQVKATTKDNEHIQLLSKQRIDRARSILAPFVLRRKKEQVLKDLPKKTCRVEYTDLNESQKKIYEDLEQPALERSRLGLQGAPLPKSDENNPMMQLRKAAIHPLLFRRWFTEEKILKMADLLRKRVPKEFSPSQPLDYLLVEMRGMSDFILHKWCIIYPCITKFDIPDLAWMNSGKVDTMVKLVKAYEANGDRVLIFSQFQMVLDILEAVLNTILVRYTRLDGDTKMDNRQYLMDDFHNDEGCTVFLLTTRAGGSGINLVGANKVIIFDSSFNPQDDRQAENRAHRVGQTREVEVVRLVTKDTVEEQILALGQSKLELDDRVAGDEEDEVSGELAVAKMFLEKRLQMSA